MAAMSWFVPRRFTAILAAIRNLWNRGTFWWAIEIRAELKSGAIVRRPWLYRRSPRPAPLHPKDERSNNSS